MSAIIYDKGEYDFYINWNRKFSKRYGEIQANHDDFLSVKHDMQIDVKTKRTKWNDFMTGTASFQLSFNSVERHLKKPCGICGITHGILLIAFKFPDRKEYYILKPDASLLERKVIDNTWRKDVLSKDRNPTIEIQLSELTSMTQWLQSNLTGVPN